MTVFTEAGGADEKDQSSSPFVEEPTGKVLVLDVAFVVLKKFDELFMSTREGVGATDDRAL